MLSFTSTDIAIASAALSICSFLLALRLAWATKFSPPRLVGVASCLIAYTFKGKTETTIERFIVPIVWFTNTGARPMLVQEIKLTISVQRGESIELRPLHSVPLEAITSANTFSEYEQLRLGLSPFGGFAVLPGERWSNCFAFPISEAQFNQLQGMSTVSFSVKPVAKSRFSHVLEQRFIFAEKKFSWLNWVGTEDPSVQYFYATGNPLSKISNSQFIGAGEEVS